MYSGAMLFAPGNADISEVFKSTTTRNFRLGQGLTTQDGRIFRYGKAGGAHVAGSLYQSEVPGANFDTLAVAAAAVGAREITVTNGATTITENLFRGGYVIVEDAAVSGSGRVYEIEGNDAEGAGSAAFVIRINPGLQEAFVAATTTVTLLKHPYDALIIHPSPPTALVVGVPMVDIASGSYGWYQTHGVASVLIEGTVIIGKMVIPSVTTDGAVAPPLLTEATPNTGGDQPTIGRVIEVAPTGKWGAIFLTIE